MTEDAGVSGVLARYYAAFSTLDAGAIVPYFYEPTLLMGPSGVFSIADSAALEAAFTSVMAGLQAREYGRSELNLQQVKILSAHSALASGIAMRYKKDGEELERIGVTYLLQKAEAGWKIAVVVLHDVEG